MGAMSYELKSEREGSSFLERPLRPGKMRRKKQAFLNNHLQL